MNSTVTQNNQDKKGLNDLFARLRANPRTPVIVVTAAVVAIVIAMVLWAKQPDYRVLYNNLSDEDGGAIITQLVQMNVPYQFDGQSGALMVPAQKVHELRLRLASQGLPKGGSVGFELLDKEKFGISQFSEQINYQRALEGELARTIETLGPVKGARVHLAIPKPSLFIREQKAPSASVTLSMQPGRTLDAGQINAVVHMISSSVAGMPSNNVTVVDQAGRLLTQPEATGRDLSDAQLKYASDVESRYQQRIETILAPIVGSGNIHAQVTAQIDFNAREQTDEQYKPNGDPEQQAIRSHQSSDSEQIGGLRTGGVPGALSNKPAPANTAPLTTSLDKTNSTKDQTVNNTATNVNSTNEQTTNNAAANLAARPAQNNRSSNTRSSNTTNYEVNRSVLHTKMNVGEVQRLSVAVVVNYRNDAAGKPVALNQAQMKQIENLTREAMGYSEQRGDSLNVVNSPFTVNDDLTNEPPLWKQPSFITQILEAGRWLLVLLVAWVLYRKLVRPLLRRKTGQNNVGTDTSSRQAGKDESASVELSKEGSNQEHQSQNRMTTEIMSQRIREMSENDPQVVALIIRQWMKDEL